MATLFLLAFWPHCSNPIQWSGANPLGATGFPHCPVMTLQEILENV